MSNIEAAFDAIQKYCNRHGFVFYADVSRQKFIELNKNKEYELPGWMVPISMERHFTRERKNDELSEYWNDYQSKLKVFHGEEWKIRIIKQEGLQDLSYCSPAYDDAYQRNIEHLISLNDEKKLFSYIEEQNRYRSEEKDYLYEWEIEELFLLKKKEMRNSSGSIRVVEEMNNLAIDLGMYESRKSLEAHLNKEISISDNEKKRGVLEDRALMIGGDVENNPQDWICPECHSRYVAQLDFIDPLYTKKELKKRGIKEKTACELHGVSNEWCVDYKYCLKCGCEFDKKYK